MSAYTTTMEAQVLTREAQRAHRQYLNATMRASSTDATITRLHQDWYLAQQQADQAVAHLAYRPERDGHGRWNVYSRRHGEVITTGLTIAQARQEILDLERQDAADRQREAQDQWLAKATADLATPEAQAALHRAHLSTGTYSDTCQACRDGWIATVQANQDRDAAQAHLAQFDVSGVCTCDRPDPDPDGGTVCLTCLRRLPRVVGDPTQDAPSAPGTARCGAEGSRTVLVAARHGFRPARAHRRGVTFTCALPAGHAGDHAPKASRCKSTHPGGATLNGRPVRCELAAGHDGQHGHSFAARYWYDSQDRCQVTRQVGAALDRCELALGHDGQHQRRMKYTTATWL